MATNYDKYIYSTGTHYISNCGSDERGKYSGGVAGDQTGKEWQLKAWYNRPWSCVLRHPSSKVRRTIAELGIEAALNDKIGYDQSQRGTFWTQLKSVGYRPEKIKTACEADCSSGVASIIKATGYLLNNTTLQNVASTNNTSTLRSALKNAGFECLTASKYISKYSYLLPGDILLYDGHHTCTNITKGKNAVDTPGTGASTGSTSAGNKLGDRILKKGMVGPDVKELQAMLMQLGYGLPKYGADGDYGDETVAAVKQFQKAHKCEADGEVGPETLAALLKAVDVGVGVESGGTVKIVGGQCYIRATPDNVNGMIMGVAKEGSIWTYAGEISTDGWLKIRHSNATGWVSGKYGKLVN